MINNLGGLATFARRFADGRLDSSFACWFVTSIHWSDFRIPAIRGFVSEFRLALFVLDCWARARLHHGAEIEIRERPLPGAVAWGGLLSGLLYVGAL